MRISISAPQTGPIAGPEALVHIATVAEGLGFDGMWVLDRILAPLSPSESYPGSSDGVLPAMFDRVLDPIATLSFLAAHTTRLSLGTSVLASPWYSAVVLARQLAAIDVLSGGRLKVGIGGGWSTDELRATGAPTDHRGQRNDEFIEAMIAAWTDDVVSYDGRFEHIPASTIGLKPAQRPHPPIYLAAYAPASLRRIARYANGWNPANIPIAVVGQMYEDLERMAVAEGRDPNELELIVRGNITLTDKPLGDIRPPFIGSFDQVIDDVRHCEDIGADEVILDVQSFASETKETYAAAIGRLADKLNTVLV